MNVLFLYSVQHAWTLTLSCIIPCPRIRNNDIDIIFLAIELFRKRDDNGTELSPGD